MMLSQEEVVILIAQEKALWREETRSDPDTLEAFLAPGFCEIGRSGSYYTREEILMGERRPINAVLPLAGLTARPLAEGVAQLTYISQVQRPDGLERARRSLIWICQNTAWRLVFHQGTPLRAEKE